MKATSYQKLKDNIARAMDELNQFMRDFSLILNDDSEVIDGWIPGYLDGKLTPEGRKYYALRECATCINNAQLLLLGQEPYKK